MENWSTRRTTLISRFSSLGPGPIAPISNPSGTVVITQAKFAAFSGVGQAQPYAVLGLCVGGGGRTRKVNSQIHMDDVWRPGKVGLALPGPAAEGFSPAMDMLAIAFDINDIPACHSEKIQISDLENAANQLIDDDLISTVMLALLRDAESHGASSAFFDHGLSLVLHRLISRTKSFSRQLYDSSRIDNQLDLVLDVIEQRLDEDLRIAELAQLAEIDARTFTRMFKRQTGYTPFQYLTLQRMARAKTLLQKNMSVIDTATSVGYANPAKFAAAFRRWVGATPNEWRTGQSTSKLCTLHNEPVN